MTIENLVQHTLLREAEQVVDSGLAARGASARGRAPRTAGLAGGWSAHRWLRLSPGRAAMMIGAESLQRDDQPDSSELDGPDRRGAGVVRRPDPHRLRRDHRRSGPPF